MNIVVIMKVLPFTIPKPTKDALIFQEDHQTSFYGYLHQHDEIQISYIKQGSGSLIVGDRVSNYRPGDVLVLGANLPHVFKSNPRISETSQMLSVFFTEIAFGPSFFNTEELKPLRSFLSKSENGFRIVDTSQRILPLFLAIRMAQQLDRFMLFLQLLKQLNVANFTSLSTFVSEKKYTDTEGQRMGAVFQYTMDHFREKITLEAVAQEAAMTPNAFCNYFKKRTRRTYISFLNEIRIEEACKLLRDQPEINIAEIAELSGFHNISNFNRKFKQLKHRSPRQFRNKKYDRA